MLHLGGLGQRQLGQDAQRLPAHARVGIRERHPHQLVHVPDVEGLQRAQRRQADFRRRVGAQLSEEDRRGGLDAEPPCRLRERRFLRPAALRT